MICLFLTTSFLFLNVKHALPDSDDIDGIGEPVDPFSDFLNQKKLAEEAAMIEETAIFFMDEYFWINFLAVACNLVTVVNMLFEAQIVVQMCLEFIDEDEETFKYTPPTL